MHGIKSLGKNYIPGSQRFAAGFLGPRGDVGYFMKFSMDKAKEISRNFDLNEIESIEAGLDGDFGENSCTIYENKEWKEYDVYEESIWATPIIIIKFKQSPMETFECWIKKEK